MARREFLFSLAPQLQEKNIGVVLIQINEAHSIKWPIGRDHCPEVQKDFEERVERANQFQEKYDCPFPIYIDDWSDEFELKFRAWPDKYYYIDQDKKVLKKSEYGTTGENDGVVTKDYSILLSQLIEN